MNNTYAAIFIGGPLDGTRRAIENPGTHYSVPVRRDPLDNLHDGEDPHYDRLNVDYPNIQQLTYIRLTCGFMYEGPVIYYDPSRFKLPVEVFAHLANHYVPF